MSLTITERQVDDVSILDLAGTFVFNDGGQLTDLIRDRLLPMGRTKILLNIADLKYLDSTGLSQLARALTDVTKAGGSLKLVAPTGAIADLLQVTRLDEIFEVHDDEEPAVDSFSLETPRRYCQCPVCGKRMKPASVAGANWDRQTCPSCGARVQVGEAAGASDAVQVLEVEVPIVEGEYFLITGDRPVTVEVVGRLNQFASSRPLDRLWSAVPSPKRVLFHLDERTEISGSGWKKLMELVSQADGADRATVVLDSIDRLPEDLRRGLVLVEPSMYQWSNVARLPAILRRKSSAGGCVYIERTTAVAALGELGAQGPWLAKVFSPFRPPS